MIQFNFVSCLTFVVFILIIVPLSWFIIPNLYSEISTLEFSLLFENWVSLVDIYLTEYLLHFLCFVPKWYSHLIDLLLTRRELCVVTDQQWNRQSLEDHLQRCCGPVKCITENDTSINGTSSRTFNVEFKRSSARKSFKEKRMRDAVEKANKISNKSPIDIIAVISRGSNYTLQLFDKEGSDLRKRIERDPKLVQFVYDATNDEKKSNEMTLKVHLMLQFTEVYSRITEIKRSQPPQPIKAIGYTATGPTSAGYGATYPTGNTPTKNTPLTQHTQRPAISPSWPPQNASEPGASGYVEPKVVEASRQRVLLKDNNVAPYQSKSNNDYNDSLYPVLNQPHQMKPVNPVSSPTKNLKPRLTGEARALFTGYLAKNSAASFTVEIAQGNLIHEQVGAIVNPANVHLSHGGGAARIIADAAGKELERECDEVLRNRARNTLQLGDAVSTTAGKLRPRIKYVIHAAGPRHDSFGGNDQRIYQTLRDTFYRSLECANNLPVDSISIPAIGSGIYGLDKKRTADVAFTAVEDFVKFVNPPIQLRLIRFVNIDDETTNIFLDVFRRRYLKCSLATQGARSRSRSAESRSNKENNINGSRNRSRSQERNRYDTDLVFSIAPLDSGNNNVKRSPKKIKMQQNGNFAGEGKYSGHSNEDENESETSGTSGDMTKLLGKKHTKQYDVQSTRQNRPKSKEIKDPILVSVRQLEANSSTEDCPICLTGITSAKKLKCGHMFCTGCIDEAFKTCGPKCPTCGAMHGIRRGNQPEGTMTINVDHNTRLPGYEQYGSIVIMYIIPDGIQGAEHPNPGYPYQGTTRKAYLPDSLEGQKVCDLLKKAFDQRLIFTVGRSATSGRDNVVTWNDIHHKTTLRGQFGYPDDTYLTRVKDELAAKGITDEDGGSRGRESSF